MARVMLYCVMLMFTLAGIVSVIYYIMLRALNEKNGKLYYIVIPAVNGDENEAGFICAARMRQILLGEEKRSRLIVADMGIPPENRRRMDDFCRENGHTEICFPGELPGKISEM
ncbi:MAG: hypothetical protein K5756_01540 [Clostridiales bacterium]|nr:hypothetical protein [Clostridiales bacterium]